LNPTPVQIQSPVASHSSTAVYIATYVNVTSVPNIQT